VEASGRDNKWGFWKGVAWRLGLDARAAGGEEGNNVLAKLWAPCCTVPTRNAGKTKRGKAGFNTDTAVVAACRLAIAGRALPLIPTLTIFVCA
jgi:hypothetical protein